MELIEWVNDILFEHWDPIGVNNHAPKNEYSRYAPEIAELVARGASRETIAERLNWIEKNRMGLRGDPENTYRVALILLARNIDEEG